MNYGDGFVAAVPAANCSAYLERARLAAEVFKEHGALGVVECWGDDLPDGKLTSFPMAVRRQADETVVFAWITWPSKEVRDPGMEKVMDDPRMKDMPMSFDGKRMIWGRFEVILDVQGNAGAGRRRRRRRQRMRKARGPHDQRATPYFLKIAVALPRPAS